MLYLPFSSPVSTTAPAPSPNKIQVFRSVQSTNLERLFRSDHKNCFVHTAADICLCSIVSIQKSGAGCIQIKANCLNSSKLFLDFTRCAGKNPFRRNRRYQDQLHRFRIDLSVCKCLPGSFHSHRNCSIFHRNMPPCNSGSLPDPCVTCIHYIFQIFIARKNRGSIRSRPAYSSNHNLSLSTHFTMIQYIFPLSTLFWFSNTLMFKVYYKKFFCQQFFSKMQEIIH